MSNTYVWPPDDENDGISLKRQWQLGKFREFALFQVCEVAAQSNQCPSRLIRGTVTNRVFVIFHRNFLSFSY